MSEPPFVIDVTEVAEMFLEAMAVIAPDGVLPSDCDDQMRATVRRAVERGAIDEVGLTEQGQALLRGMFGIRRH